ncbi:MAG TPA: phosphatase PAP2 family protein [Myxococcota bacterium]|nr:phosphatase PAP2 family protein [Myxococcota bacterium]
MRSERLPLTLWREHAPLAVLVGLYLAGGYAVDAALGDVMVLSLRYPAVEAVAVLFVVLFLGGHALRSLPRVPDGVSAFRFIWEDLKTSWLQPRRLAGFAIVYALLPLFMSTFGSLKVAIPRMVPFEYDRLFHDWDVALHGGPPFEWLHPTAPLVTVAINVAYNAWIFLFFGILIWQAFSMHRRLRARFLLSFVLLWILAGTLLATLTSSVGPCFWAELYPGEPDPYAGLMAELHMLHEVHHLWAVDVQEQLWAAYERGTVETVAGISAMPSMHVATSVLFALLGWARHRVLGVALGCFAAIILVGSVHLGWHYAVDGYVGAVCGVLVWVFVGLAMRWSGWMADEAEWTADEVE